MIVPEHLLRHVTDLARAPFAGAPIGTGPYRVEHWDRGSSIDLRANPAYFRGAPHIEHLQILFAGDENTLAVQKHTGELDFVPKLPLTQISTFASTPALTVRVVPTYYLDYLIANTHRAPFDDVRVRKAFALAVDRDALVRTSYHGAAQSADAFVPPFSRFHSPAAGASGRPDAAAARALLDAAGWRSGPDGVRRKNGASLTFALTTLAAQSVLLSAAVQLQAAWRGIGAAVDLRPLQSTLVFGPQGVLAQGNYSLAFVNYGELSQPDISDNVSSAALPPHGANYSGFVDRDVDRWLLESRTLDDVNARRKVVERITARLRQTAPQTPVLWESFLYAWSGDLVGVRPETINSDFWNVGDWSWK